MIKERKIKKQLQGLCYDCNNPVEEGKRYCLHHLLHHREKSALYAKKYPEKKRAHGAKDSKKKRGWCRANKICVLCKNSNLRGTLLCIDCSKKRVEKKNQMQQKRLDNGFCKYCGKTKLPHCESLYCINCFLTMVLRTVKNISQEELLQKFESQQHICPYSGRKLTLSLDATLDHIIPKSKGGADHIDNLQWIYGGKDFNVNFMKCNYDEGSFLKAIKEIYEFKNLSAK